MFNFLLFLFGGLTGYLIGLSSKPLVIDNTNPVDEEMNKIEEFYSKSDKNGWSN